MLRMAGLLCQFCTVYIWVGIEPNRGSCFGGVCAKPPILSSSARILATVAAGSSVRLPLASCRQHRSQKQGAPLRSPWAFPVLKMHSRTSQHACMLPGMQALSIPSDSQATEGESSGHTCLSLMPQPRWWSIMLAHPTQLVSLQKRRRDMEKGTRRGKTM